MNPFVRGVCNFLGSVSSQQKFEATDQCYSPLTDHVTALGQSSVTAPCYSSVLFRKIKENASSRCEGRPTQKMWRGERERETERGKKVAERERGPWPFGSSFYTFFSSPWACLCKLGKLWVQFVLSDVLILVLRPSFVLFSQTFPFLVF